MSGSNLPVDTPEVPVSTGLTAAWLGVGLVSVAVAALVGVAVGPVDLPLGASLRELADRLPGVQVESGLTATQTAVLWEIRAPRVVLGILVGALLAGAGAGYQGVFRNPLADPFLLGIAAGAGLGATLAIVGGWGNALGPVDAVPAAAFVGALSAVGAAAWLGHRPGAGGSPATLLLAGIAVAAFFTAIQTYIQQQHADTLRDVYTWILGRLSTTGWSEVTLLLPYAVVCGAVLMLSVGAMDLLAVGDEEAGTLGLRPGWVRAGVLVAASLATAAAVAVSGLIGFVGLVVPHAVRLVAGVSNRLVVPMSMLFGGAFLALTDVLARTLQAPAELPIGVLTAFVGAPFFLFILRSHPVS